MQTLSGPQPTVSLLHKDDQLQERYVQAWPVTITHIDVIALLNHSCQNVLDETFLQLCSQISAFYAAALPIL